MGALIMRYNNNKEKLKLAIKFYAFKSNAIKFGFFKELFDQATTLKTELTDFEDLSVFKN